MYPVDEKGNVSEIPLVLHQPQKTDNIKDIEAVWISGWTEDIRRRMGNRAYPCRFPAGRFKPHTLEYIPEGDYILREIITPYGFLQSADIPFTMRTARSCKKQK